MKRLLVRIIAFTIAFQLGFAPVSAQPAIPDEADFGDGWTATGEMEPEEFLGTWTTLISTDALDDVTGYAYWGPQGARVVVIALTVSDKDLAFVDAWDAAEQLQVWVPNNVVSDYALQSETPPSLDVCYKLKRVGGMELGSTLPFGSTLCTPDQRTIVLTIVYGTVDGMSQLEASDTITLAVLGEE